MVDDGSTDHTDEYLLRQFGHRSDFKLLRITENKGVSFARNFGAYESRADWLAFLDSDDEWLPTKLSEQLSLLDLPQSRWPLVHCNELWLKDGKPLNQKAKHRKMGGDLFERSLDLCLISPSAALIEKEFFLQIGGFKEDFIVCEDYDLWLRVTAKAEVGFCEQALLSKYGGHADQLSKRLKAMDLFRVRAIYQLLHSQADLDEVKRKAALQVGLKKTEILLKGFTKHQNFKNHAEVEHIRQFFVRGLTDLGES